MIQESWLTLPWHLALVFLMPFICALSVLCIKHDNLRDTFSIASGIILAGLVLSLCHYLPQGSYFPETLDVGAFVTLEALRIFPEIAIAFHIEPLSMIFAIVASILWPITTLYALGYMRGNKEKHLRRFACCFALSITAVMGLAFAANLFTLFIFYEMLTFATLPLVMHAGTEKAHKGGKTYLTYLLGSSILFLLPAIVITWSVTGTVAFTSGGILAGHVSPTLAGILLILFMYGIGKAALMPLHGWLPAAMVAPTPVSALLHAVAVVKAGVFCVVKIITYIFGPYYLGSLAHQPDWIGNIVIYMAGITVLTASIIALRQDNIKRMLAYSTVSQLSYVTMAALILAPEALMAASFHIAAHAVSKITLFFAAGAIYTSTKKTNISQLDGIARFMPYTMAAFTIAALSMIGLPPTAGIVTKFYMMSGAFEFGAFFVIIVLTISTLLNAAYFLPILYRAYLNPPLEKKPLKEAPTAIVIALCITAGLTLLLFFMPELFLQLATQMAIYE